jgi:hypothetical protein
LNKHNHWVININTTGESIILAKAFTARPPIIYNRKEIMRRFASSVLKRYIPFDKVSVKMWQKLIAEGYVQLQAESAADESKGKAM